MEEKNTQAEENRQTDLIEECTCDRCINQPRYRSKAAWAALLALVGLVLGTFGLYEKLGIDDSQFQSIVDMLLTALVAFGILNNPTSKNSF